jgi:hypothetical protein
VCREPMHRELRVLARGGVAGGRRVYIARERWETRTRPA